jgi:hypothetical protein
MFCVAPYSPSSENKKCPPIQNFGGVQEVSGNSFLAEQSFRRTPSHFITSNIPTSNISQNSCQLSISPPSGFSAIKMALQSVQSPSQQGKMESLHKELNNESLPSSSQHEIPSPSSKSSNRSSKSARSDFLNFVDDLLSPMEVDPSPINSLSSPHGQVIISSRYYYFSF